MIAFEGGILGQGVALVSSSVSLPHLRVIFCCKTLLYRSLNQNYNILYSEHLIYDLYVCICVFLLHQEFFDMILINNPSFYDGGVTPPDPNTSPWGRWGRPCAVHGWGCPNRVTPDQGPSSSSHRGKEAGGEEEDDERCITVVPGPVGAPAIHRMAHISIGPRGRPQGPLVS
jgi:hypothetical protein